VTPAELTPRQREVAQYVADGLTNKVIAVLMGVTDRRVQVLVSSIAFRLRNPDEKDDKDERVSIALWWREQEQQSAA
jgi:DNA-binding NarL/FixJ family response regulator